MNFRRLRILQAFVAGADGDEPVRAHLHVFIAGFERIVMEGVALRFGALRGPDHGLVRIGEAAALEVRHRVGLAPHDVVQDPEVEILQGRADAEDVVIGADHPERRVLLHHAAHGDKPGAGERVVVGKARELVPVVVDRVDEALVRTRERLFELEIVGRIREDHVHALGRKLLQIGDAVAEKNLIERKRIRQNGEGRFTPRPRSRRSPPGTRDMDPEAAPAAPVRKVPMGDHRLRN